MLQVVSDPPDARWSYQKKVVDDERDLLLASLGMVAGGTIYAFRLDWGDRTIPVAASASDYKDDEGREHRDYSHVQVNGAGVGAVYGIDPYMFSSDSERAEAQKLADECVLAFGKLAQGYETAIVDGAERLVTLRDFGY